MNKRYFILLLAIVLFSCTPQSSTSQVYKEENLLLAYLSKFHSNEINDSDFLLFTYRTEFICKTCREIPLDSTLKLAITDSPDKQLYILTDNQVDFEEVKKICTENIHCIIGDAHTMDLYGIPKMEPLLFEIKNQKIIRVKNWYRH